MLTSARSDAAAESRTANEEWILPIKTERRLFALCFDDYSYSSVVSIHDYMSFAEVG